MDVYSNTVDACGVHIITVDHKVIGISVNKKFVLIQSLFHSEEDHVIVLTSIQYNIVRVTSLLPV